MVRATALWTPPRIQQDEFVEEYWDYDPGEHVSFFGRTGSGKTTLQFKLLDQSISKDNRAIILQMKPRDETFDKWAKTLDVRSTENWPPSFFKRIRDRNRRGWILKPRHQFDATADNEAHRAIFKKVISDNYKRGKRITVADEVYGLAKELRLADDLIAVWTKGRSMENGLWGGTQRPAWVPGWMYNQPQHLFIAHEADKQARKRYTEIGGIDPSLVDNTVMGLEQFEFMYIRRNGKNGRPESAIIAP